MTALMTPHSGGLTNPTAHGADPQDLEDIIERLHIGTLQREKLRVGGNNY